MENRISRHLSQTAQERYEVFFNENKEICWQGNLFVKGLFDGKHSFKLIDNNDNITTFIQSEIFSGIFIPFCSNMIENKTLKGFHLMNEKLKEIVEEKCSRVSV